MKGSDTLSKTGVGLGHTLRPLNDPRTGLGHPRKNRDRARTPSFRALLTLSLLLSPASLPLLDCMYLLRYGKVPTFIDGTFYCCPKGFYQLMIIMVYDMGRKLYVPVWWVLLDNKTEATYKAMFEMIGMVHRKHDIEWVPGQLTCGT